MEFACSIHTKFVYIHPFGDGNGRTARIILDTILLSAECPTLIIKSDEKPRYIETLLQCNRGEISGLIELYTDTLKSALDKLENDFNSESTRINKSSFEAIYANIDLDEDPLITALRKKASQDITSKLDMYNAFYAECEAFRESFIQVIHHVRTNNSCGSDVNITSSKLGDLSLEAFREIIETKDKKPFWYFSLSVNEKKAGDKSYIFYFKLEENSECGISIFLGKSGESSGLLLSDPIRLRELRYKSADSKLVAIKYDQSESDSEYSVIAKRLIAEIIQFYILA